MLLKNTDLSISEIAVAVGFEDSNYFSRAFKRSYGLTPREHRALS
jgi:AraC-like DNA-binding protein